MERIIRLMKHKSKLDIWVGSLGMTIIFGDQDHKSFLHLESYPRTIVTALDEALQDRRFVVVVSHATHPAIELGKIETIPASGRDLIEVRWMDWQDGSKLTDFSIHLRTTEVRKIIDLINNFWTC